MRIGQPVYRIPAWLRGVHLLRYPKDEYEKHQHELEQFRKGDCKYVIDSLDDLPKVGSIRELK